MMNKGEPLADNQIIVYEELPLPEESEREVFKNRQLLCDNLELILANADKIIYTPAYYQIRHGWSYIGSNWIGSRHIPLGVLLQLWQKDLWLGECPHCSGKAYIFQAGGSILSGRYRYDAVCPACREIVANSCNTGLYALIKPAFELYNTTIQKRKILRTKGSRFSWSKGVVGEQVPDQTLEDVVKPASLETMIESL